MNSPFVNKVVSGENCLLYIYYCSFLSYFAFLLYNRIYCKGKKIVRIFTIIYLKYTFFHIK